MKPHLHRVADGRCTVEGCHFEVDDSGPAPTVVICLGCEFFSAKSCHVDPPTSVYNPADDSFNDQPPPAVEPTRPACSRYVPRGKRAAVETR